MKHFHCSTYEVKRIGFMSYDVFVNGKKVDTAYQLSDGENKAKKYIINHCLSPTYIREHRDKLRTDCKELLKVD